MQYRESLRHLVRARDRRPRRFLPLLVALLLLVARDAPARAFARSRLWAYPRLAAAPREERVAAWARDLAPIEVGNISTPARTRLRLYDLTGGIDPEARAEFERVASREPDPHQLAPRVEQLVVKTAYHFGAARVVVVSGWREHAGKHGTAEALDFKLEGVRASEVAAYLRGLPQLGVGLYTHPGTQFVHVDVRDRSYHWVDASPPGVHWTERALRDTQAVERDASYEADMDLPI